MDLKYHCPNCGTSLGYEGLCWKCKSEKERSEVLSWTQEQICRKARISDSEHSRTGRFS